MSFPGEPLVVQPSDSFYLDSSFVVDGLANEVNCVRLLDALGGHGLFVSPLVWAETVHALVRTYLADDLKKAMAGQEAHLIHPEAARAVLAILLRQQANSGGFWTRNALRDILKSQAHDSREMLLPYQRSAVAAAQDFLANSGATMLVVDSSALARAEQLCTEVPCDTNDALHLALAHSSGCSHAVTTDADWARVPAPLRPTVVEVA